MDKRNLIKDINIFWSKDGEIVENGSEDMEIFVLESASFEDAGHYQCHFQSRMENKTSTSSIINVYSPMNVTQTPNNMKLIEGSKATLVCEALVDSNLLDVTTISWFMNDVFIHSEATRSLSAESSNEGVSYSKGFINSKLIFPTVRKVINLSFCI